MALAVSPESWNTAKTELTLEVSGRAGSQYDLNVWNPGQISSVEGAAITKLGKLEIQIPQGAADSYLQQKVVLHFGRTRRSLAGVSSQKSVHSANRNLRSISSLAATETLPRRIHCGLR